MAGRFRVILRERPAIKARLQEVGLNSRQLQLIAYVREHGKIINRAYRELTGLSDEAARKEIGGLLDLGLLEQVGKGRSTAYIPKKRVGDSKGWGKPPNTTPGAWPWRPIPSPTHLFAALAQGRRGSRDPGRRAAQPGG